MLGTLQIAVPVPIAAALSALIAPLPSDGPAPRSVPKAVQTRDSAA